MARRSVSKGRKAGVEVKRLLLVFVGFLLVAGLVGTLVGRLALPERVYTVAEIQAEVRQHRSVFSGRMVWVRGNVAGWLSTLNCAGGGNLGFVTCPRRATVWVQMGTASPNWTITLPPGVRPQIVPGQGPSLPPGLYTLPIVGRMLAAFIPPPGPNDVTVRVRITQPTATRVLNPDTYSDGVLLVP